MRVKFVSIKQCARDIARYQAMLDAHPDMWPGPKSGFKALITANQNLIKKHEVAK